MNLVICLPKSVLARLVPVLVPAALGLGGCAVTDRHEFTPVMPRLNPEEQALPARPVTGSIYADGGGLLLFEDRTAREVGDIITVRLVERTNASKQASANADKTASVALTNPSLFGAPVSIDGNDLSASVSGSREFEGGGGAAQSNSLSGAITAVVVGVYPNGNLAIRGEKMLVLNQGEEFIQVSGVVRPEDVFADNSVLSTQIADAKIVYSGNGAAADASAVGWLGRFFLSPLWPF